LDLQRPKGFSFLAGQGIRISINGLERDYSLVCGPDDGSLSICVKVIEEGALSPLLARLKIGTSVSFSGPHGCFTFQSRQHLPVFVATGTGIAPFVAMVRAGIRGFTLLHGASTADRLYYRELTQPNAAKYVGCITRENGICGDESWKYHGRVSDFLRTEFANGVYDFYLCGGREMVRDVLSTVDERFPGSRAFFEIFF
jgi:ferredoxin-NADP reductase